MPYISTLHRDLNILGSFLGNTKFDEESVLFYIIDYEISKTEKFVNIEIIVDNGVEKWRIPSSVLDVNIDKIELKNYSA